MARTLTTRDAYALINAVAHEALGANATIQAVDSSTFVSVGEAIIASGMENTLNALGLVLGRTMVAVRPYKARFALINSIGSGAYANRIRKISYYTKDALPTGADNTQLYTNFAAGYDNGTNSAASTASMWEQNPPVPLELNFGGSSEWQYCITIYEHQLKVAFSSESEFITFMNGVMTAAANDIEIEKQAFSQVTLLNFMAGLYNLNSYNGSVINLTSEFNTKFGTSYTAAQLRSTYLTEFLEFFTARVKELSDQFENADTRFHCEPAVTGHYMARHTPKSKQRMFLLSEFVREAESYVFPQIFNPEYLKIENFEKVLYWQNPNAPASIKVTPAIPDLNSSSATYKTQIAGSQVTQTNVIGLLFDEDALMVDFQLDDVRSTPVEARKAYRNLWHTIRKNAINDFSEKAVLFIM